MFDWSTTSTEKLCRGTRATGPPPRAFDTLNMKKTCGTWVLAGAAGICLSFGLASIQAQSTGVFREVWTGIAGTSVADLTNNVNFPSSPSSEEVLATFEAPTDVMDDYGQRLMALIRAPQTGSYTFWIASDDGSTLFLSTDATATNKREIASVPGWTSAREWGKYAEQTSSPVSLVAGQNYYIEALMKEGGGGDNLAVRWQLPDATWEEPIPGSRLTPFGMAPPQITQQPANTTVMEGDPATFTIGLARMYGVSYRWQSNQVNIAGATASSLVITPTPLAANLSSYRCIVTNLSGSVTSAPATLYVNPDNVRPALVGARNNGQTTLQVVFSEGVAAPSATTPGNYTLNNGATVSAAAFGADTRTVALTTSTLAFGTTYRLTVNNVQDRAVTPNTISPGSYVDFTASEYASTDIGNPPLAGSQTRLGSSAFDIVGSGTIGGTSDSFHFDYEMRTGNFDVRVRVPYFEPTDAWAVAGLMARESLNANSTFAAALATPAMVGSFFESRATTGAGATTAGYFPVNYPETWLRLVRSGNTLTGYASLDGQNWTQLGTATITMPATLYFGLVVASRDSSDAASVQFRDIGASPSPIVGNFLPSREPLGPSSRHTPLVISEIMYHPAERADGKQLEFVELFNSGLIFADLSGYRLSGAVDFAFPNGTMLPAGGFLVVARVPADVQSVYGIANVLGGYTNSMPNDSGTIRLRTQADAVVQEATYDTTWPWPVAADGAGHSLVLARPSYGSADPRAWAASDVIGGSPGTYDAIRSNPQASVVINEILAHTDPPLLDFIELYNHSNAAVDLSGCYLTDDPTTNRFRIPNGTSIPARGFVVYDSDQLGFMLNAEGESVFLVSSNATRVIDAVRFSNQENSVSSGRYPDGSAEFHPLTTRTAGSANTRFRVSDVVINEIMYNPISGDSADEFVEIYNWSGAQVNLGGWRLGGGISFTFPTNTSIAANSYLVVANSLSHLLTNYPGVLNVNNTLGNYGGSLADGGERITLTKPDTILHTNNSVVVTNTIHIVLDEVRYRSGGRWPQWSDGGGSSLELIDPNSDHLRPSSWADSDETSKSAWATLEWTGVMDNGNGNYDPTDCFQMHQLGAGECLVDDVEAFESGGGNLIPNPTFNTDASGWVFQGNHRSTTREAAGGTGNSGCLHVRTTGRGDTGANRIRTTLSNTTALSSGKTVTLRAKVRWLKGWPEFLLRLRGNWLEAAGPMSLPKNLGTPGQANSRRVTNAGPAIFDVKHTPVLPAGGQAVVVSARVSDPHGLGTIRLTYRVDPSGTPVNVTMVDSGAGGDAVAGDGFYSGTIPAQGAGTMVAFYIQATDTGSPTASTRFPSDAPTRECLVRWGETQPLGNLGAYRLWQTQANYDLLRSREPLANDPLDATFVYGDQRAIYNISMRGKGSPWHGGSIGNDYIFAFPDDDQLLGDTDMALVTVGNSGNDNALQHEQTAFWIAERLGTPTLYRRFVYFFENGGRKQNLYEDTEEPNGRYVSVWSPNDSNGDLYKIEDWFEFDDAGLGFSNVDATLQRFTTTGGALKLARYRWDWRKRAVQDSASNYTNLFELVDAVNAADPEYTRRVENLVDVEEWMRVFAMEHIVGNWDAYSYGRGKNMYAYKPTEGKWRMMPWDIDFVLGLGSDGPTTDLFGCNDPTITRMFNLPAFRRAYWRAVEDAVNGPLVAANVAALVDSKYDALIANGISLEAPTSLKQWIDSRRTYLVGQLSAVASGFAVTSNNGNNFSTGQNYLTLTGTAPIAVKTIEINGIAYPVTWTGLNTWTLNYALRSGANALTIVGYDLRGNAVAGSSDTITITYTGGSVSPQGNLVINEIMYNGVLPGTSFVEIYNRSTTTAFDLSNYRINGIDFTFPEGTLIQAGAYLVVVSDPFVFPMVYGDAIPIAGVYSGSLDNGGETLQLIQPGASPDLDAVIDEVTYDDDLPWPTAADGFGPSLQLIDSTQDNNRVANWAAVTTNATASPPQWQYVTATGTAGDPRLYLYLQAAGDVYIDDLKVVAGGTPEVGANFAVNGDFESALSTGWTTTANTVNSAISATTRHSGNGGLHLVCEAGGTTQGNSLWQSVAGVSAGSQYTLSFWYLPNTNGGTLTVRFSGNWITTSQNTLWQAGGSNTQYTPGAANSTTGMTLETLPLVWLNEVQPNNLTGLQDRMGDRDPWVELYNSGTNSADLTGFYLSDTYTNLTKWPFPASTLLASSQFRLVWLDNEPGETGAGELHANFRASPTNGSVVLTRVSGSVTTIVDFLNYAPINSDRSYGAWPNGTPAKRQKFYYATPGVTNNPGWPDAPVYINEWMAGNSGTLADPVDGDWDDWFELYNDGPVDVDLSGYVLEDGQPTPTQWTIPTGTIIPANGYLLVWADGETGQNGSGGSDLHAKFKLGLAGDGIHLLAPNGTNIDSVTFGQQTNDISQGRWPDANSSFYYMTAPTPREANTIGNTNNAPPVLNGIGNRSGNEGALITFTASATDPNSGQTLTFSLDPGAPANAAINPASGVFTWTPTEVQGPASYPVTVRVRDNGSPALSDSETITITVNEVNVGPSLSGVSDRNVSEGSLLSFTVLGTDPDIPSQALTYSLSGAPSGASINPANGVFSWTPSEAQGPATYSNIVIRVTDNGSPSLFIEESFTVVVNEVNVAPILTKPADATIDELVAWSLQLSASDSDLPPQTLTYSLVSGPAGLTVSGTGLVSWTPTEAQGPSTNTVTVKVADNGAPSLTATQAFTLTVREVNVAPILTKPADATIDELVAWSLQLSASDSDLPAQTLTYSLVSGPAGLTVSGTGLVSWIPTEAQGPSTNTVTVKVADSGTPSLTATQAFTLTVREVNVAPILTKPADQTIAVGSLLSFTILATDSDTPTNRLTFSLGAGAPQGAAVNPNTGAFTWTPSTNQAPSTNTITVTVTDNGSPVMSRSQNFQVVVNAATVLRLTHISVDAGGSVSVVWDSQPGKTYNLEYRDSLPGSTWSIVNGYTATSSTTTGTHSTTGSVHRYYRVVQMN
jgi:hypothetical protein